MLNKMSVHNFDWTLHSLLFLHTQRVILKQQKGRNEDDNEDEEEEIGIDIDNELDE